MLIYVYVYEYVYVYVYIYIYIHISHCNYTNINIHTYIYISLSLYRPCCGPRCRASPLAARQDLRHPGRRDLRGRLPPAGLFLCFSFSACHEHLPISSPFTLETPFERRTALELKPLKSIRPIWGFTLLGFRTAGICGLRSLFAPCTKPKASSKCFRRKCPQLSSRERDRVLLSVSCRSYVPSGNPYGLHSSQRSPQAGLLFCKRGGWAVVVLESDLVMHSELRVKVDDEWSGITMNSGVPSSRQIS